DADKQHNADERRSSFTAAELLTLHYGIDPLFFQNAATTTITRSMSEVIKFVARRNKDTYVFKAAQGLHLVRCIGAVPGTAGDFKGLKYYDDYALVKPEDYGSILKFFPPSLPLQL